MLIPKIKCHQDLTNKNGTCYNFAHSFMGTLNGSVALLLIQALMFKGLIRVKTSKHIIIHIVLHTLVIFLHKYVQ